MTENFRLHARGLRKSFGGVEVLHGIDLVIEGGKVTAVVGENGAGKSTMIKIISGVYQPDSGHLEINGERVAIQNPREGQRLGIRVIYQEMTNAPTLSVAENIFLGHLPNRFGLVQRREAYQQARAILSKLGVDLDPKQIIGRLSIAEHQVVEIARALVSEARLMIFDEPTSALSPDEVENLFNYIRRLREQGVAIIYITHRLYEVPEIADEVVVIRDGNLVAQGPVAEFDRDRIVEAMTGEALKSFSHHESKKDIDTSKTPVLKVTAASLPPVFDDISLEVYAGEIVSIFGRVGSGAMEVGEALFGLRKLASGHVTIQTYEGQPSGPRAAKTRGLGFVPVDRKSQGLLRGLSAGENLTVASWGTLSNFLGVLTTRAMAARYDFWKDRLTIRGAGGSAQEIGKLSGGNQQKVILGRWLENRSQILVLAEPTRGVDVGARAEIYEALETLANEGMAILVISTDAEEVLRISDRIIVMAEGRITDTMPHSAASLARLAASAAASVSQALSPTQPKEVKMTMNNRSIIDISHDFFDQIVLPILQREFPQETKRMTFGLFGHGSEALRMDDQYSRDHHWGIRIDALMPKDIFENRREEIMRVLGKHMPTSFQGHELGESTRAGAGLAPDNLESFLKRTIGIDHPPRTYEEWLKVPEPDIIHITNGEVWHDPDGRFTEIRDAFREYYPDLVWLRRIAHWCRYYSGMGTYALKRAILRENELYATTRFANAIRLGVQLAFMLDRQYYPYDKWLYDFFTRLPRMYERLADIVDEAVSIRTGWERKLELLDHMSDVLDQTMVEDGIVKPHPKFVGSASSGYRLMEYNYQQILKGLPDDLIAIIPEWEQPYLEQFVAQYVKTAPVETWSAALNLTPVE